MKRTKIRFAELIESTLNALVDLGGSGSIAEIYNIIAKEYSEETLGMLHNSEIDSRTEVAYQLAWTRTTLKKAGYLENSSRGVWALTSFARQELRDRGKFLGGKEIRKQISGSRKNEHPTEFDSVSNDQDEYAWKENLLRILVDKMSLSAFERLMQRMLREAGFTHVEVTSRTGNEEINGTGILRVNGLIGFRIAFQCKRYRGSVRDREIRNFRGGTVGYADRGIFISTGTFTKAAVDEATRDGTTPIDLMDGTEIAEKLKKFSLGVTTKKIERIVVDPTWFQGL